jgi:hypothetical protein
VNLNGLKVKSDAGLVFDLALKLVDLTLVFLFRLNEMVACLGVDDDVSLMSMRLLN